MVCRCVSASCLDLSRSKFSPPNRLFFGSLGSLQFTYISRNGLNLIVSNLFGQKPMLCYTDYWGISCECCGKSRACKAYERRYEVVFLVPPLQNNGVRPL